MKHPSGTNGNIGFTQPPSGADKNAAVPGVTSIVAGARDGTALEPSLRRRRRHPPLSTDCSIAAPWINIRGDSYRLQEKRKAKSNPKEEAQQP